MKYKDKERTRIEEENGGRRGERLKEGRAEKEDLCRERKGDTSIRAAHRRHGRGGRRD